MVSDSNDSCLLAIEQLHHAKLAEDPADLILNRLVVMIANCFETDVGSLYLLEQDGDHLMLVATVGLLQSCVGHLQMTRQEGLVGLVAELQEPVVLAEATRHPRFKYFPEADEDKYRSFLGVPVMDCGMLRGVLVVQTIETRVFTEGETLSLSRVATLLGTILSALLA